MVTTTRLARQLETPEVSWTRHTEVVVIGSGAAGIAVALQLLGAGIPAVMICRGTVLDTSTSLSTTHVSPWRQTPDFDDAWQAGRQIADAGALQQLLDEAPAAVARLDRLAKAHDTQQIDPHESIGQQVQRTLLAALRGAVYSPRSSLRVDDATQAIDVLTDSNGEAAGVRVLRGDGTIGDYLAKAVVMASGGGTRLWSRSTGPAVATGDGMAMALRAGALLRDLEFVAFTPTGLDIAEPLPGDRVVTLGKELRRAGALLVDGQGRPALAGAGETEFAPDDELALTIHRWLDEHDGQQLFLDGRGIGERVWEMAPFAATGIACRERGIDPTRKPLPVRPAAQFMVGGIAVDALGATTVPGLYAAGEVACTGARGAAGPENAALIEALVGGLRVGKSLTTGPLPHPGKPEDRALSGAVPASARHGIHQAVDSSLGLEREHNQLQTAADFLSRLPNGENLGPLSLEATNYRAVGAAITAAAIARPESRGWHYRSDHPEESQRWERTVMINLDDSGLLKVTTKNVPKRA